MYKKLFLFIFFLPITERVDALPDFKDSIDLACSIVQHHPFITAAVIVVLLQRKPLEFITEIITYFLKEHPILTAIIIGLLISGYYREIINCANGLGMVLRCALCFCSWLAVKAEGYFYEFYANSGYTKRPKNSCAAVQDNKENSLIKKFTTNLEN